MKLIFLDVDGVLNSHKFFEEQKQKGLDSGSVSSMVDIEKIKLLNSLLDDKTKVVLSSSWRLMDELCIKLEKTLGIFNIKLFGKTPSSRFELRGREISDFLNSLPLLSDVTHIVIFDDDSDFLPWQKPLHIQTSMKDGLQPHHIEKAREILSVPVRERF